jgi:hypothetical protein
MAIDFNAFVDDFDRRVDYPMNRNIFQPALNRGITGGHQTEY